MGTPFLVATSTPGFGELIESTLRETGRFDVVLVKSTQDAVQEARKNKFEACILDADLDEDRLASLAHALKTLSPAIKLVVISSGDEAQKLVKVGISPDAVLPKPFYLPDLIEKVDVMMHSSTPTTADHSYSVNLPSSDQKTAAPPAWFEDVNRVAQHLTRLSLETSAQAALIVREERLWAYAGQLSQQEALELAETVSGYLAHETIRSEDDPADRPRTEGKIDLARFTRLQSGGEYIVYATSLVGGMTLALAFDVKTPFSNIRSQAGKLARSLASPPELSTLSQNHIVEQATVEPAPTDIPSDQPGDFLESLRHELPAKPFWSEPPPPLRGNIREELPFQPPFVDFPEQEPSSSSDAQPNEFINRFARYIAENAPLAENEPVETAELPTRFPAVYTEREPETQRAVIETDLEPVSPTIVNLSYVCILAPRMPTHHLVGDLAAKLPEWLGQLCLAFGWRIERISLTAEYLLWVLRVSPATSPNYMIRIIRQHTSRRIFADFPNLARENPSRDFWAPGYLIMSSLEPPSAQIIQDFIKQTRRYQGIVNANAAKKRE